MMKFRKLSASESGLQFVIRDTTVICSLTIPCLFKEVYIILFTSLVMMHVSMYTIIN